MAIQYTVPIKSYDDVDWRANIYTDLYSGNPITLKGSEGQSMMLDYDGDTDNHFGVFVESRLTLNVIVENNVDVNQLQNAADRQYRIEIQRNNILYWVGYMISDGIQQPLKSEAYVLSLEAICGLSMLDSMPYSHSNLPGITSTPNRCVMNYIRQILFSQSNLNVPIPIRWTNGLRCTVFEGQDVFIGDVRWSPRGEGFDSYQTDSNGKPVQNKKNKYILEGILKSNQCRIYQNNGRWTIRRIPNYFNGAFQSRQINGDLGIMKPALFNEAIVKRIGNLGYNFINEDAVITSIPGIKSCKITYNSDVRDNIVPNGNLDIVSTGALLYWNIFESDGSAYYQTDISLDGRDGNSAKLFNTSGSNTAYFTLSSQNATLYTNGLPIDGKNLVKLINFSFLFSPTQYGFPIEGTINGVITGLIIQNEGGLYPNGFHTNVRLLNDSLVGLYALGDVTVVSNKVVSVVIRSGGQNYNVNDVLLVALGNLLNPSFVRVTTTENVPGIVNFDSNPLQLQIVMNLNGNQWFLDDFGIWRDTVTTVISPKIESLKVGDVARVALDKFRGVILPEPEFKPKAGDTCDIKILFLIKPGQVYTVDNISLTIEKNDDVYVSTVNNSKETKEEEDSLEISSSFGGYMVSNFMTNWDRSDSESEFKDGEMYSGTLTGLTADARLRCKHTASKIFNGSINVRDANWSFDEIYTIETLADRRFMPLNAKYNIEKCEVALVAIETRNDDISRTEIAFGSNDNQLSN